MSENKLTNLLRTFDPEGEEYGIPYEQLDITWDYSSQELEKYNLNRFRSISLNNDLPIFNLDALVIPNNQIPTFANKIGLPSKIEDYPKKYQKEDLRQTILGMLLYFNRYDFHQNSYQLNRKIINSFRNDLILEIDGTDLMRIMLIKNGQKIRQVFDKSTGDILSHEVYDISGRLNYYVHNHLEEIREISIVDLPAPFYIIFRAYKDSRSNNYNSLYFVLDPQEGMEICVSPRILLELYKYKDKYKKDLALQIHQMLSQQVIGIAQMIVEYVII